MGKRKPPGYWTLDRCKEAAMNYKTRTEWIRSNKGIGYQIARRNGWLDKCCEHMSSFVRKEKLTLEHCENSAKDFNYVSDWQEKHMSEYNKALARGWLERCCAHMARKPAANKFWTLSLCKQSSIKYKTKIRWQKSKSSKDRGAYKAAHKYGWLDECCPHMQDEGPSDNDTVYAWKAPGEYFNGKPVYKFGITSERLGLQRVIQVNKKAQVIIIAKVSGRATLVEKELLKLGDDPQYAEGDGRTEYRALSDHELTKALDIIKEAA